VQDQEPIKLKAKVAAGYLSVSRSTLAKWRMKRIGPPAHRLGPRLVYYLKHEIDAWPAECDREQAAAQTPSSRAQI
jgi:predicted DNA-binding transcriptional regulator AlpA